MMRPASRPGSLNFDRKHHEAELERVRRLVEAHPGLTGEALAPHGLRYEDGALLAELEALGLVVYVKDAERSGWYLPGAAAERAKEAAEARWWEQERARDFEINSKVRARRRYRAKKRRERA